VKRLVAASLLLAACGSSQLERVPIPPGTGVQAAADSLAAHHVIWSRTLFGWIARWDHVGHKLRAGIYQFRRSASMFRVLHELKAGNAMHFRVTLPPGGTIFDLARNVQRRLGIPVERTLAAARDSTLRHEVDASGPSVEGWLLPESFDFGGFDTAQQIVTRFVDARRRRWDSTWDTIAQSQHLDRASLLTLASIVQAEATDSSELPLIAAVYRNRLRLHMPLQADPTVEYAYLLETGARKGRLYDVDYRHRSPWNTYLHPGLPPGPVGNPSRNAIEAVLHPAAVTYLYFVTAPNGKAVFASTYAEQLRNIRRLRAQM
jgi:UPF0755 protein